MSEVAKRIADLEGRIARLNNALNNMAVRAGDAEAKAKELREALTQMVAVHPKSSHRFGSKDSLVRRSQEDQERAIDAAVAVLSKAAEGGAE